MPDGPAPLPLAEDVVAVLVDLVTDTAGRLGAAACSVALVQDDELVYVAAGGVGADAVRGMRLPAGQGIGGFVAASGQALVVADVRRDPRHDRTAAARSGYLPTSILAVPVEDEEGPVGVLTVLDRAVGADDLEVAAAAAEQVARVLAAAADRTGAPAADADAADHPLDDAPDDALEELQGLVHRLAARSAAERREAVRLLHGLLEP